LKNPSQKWVGGVAEGEGLSSNPSTAKKKKKFSKSKFVKIDYLLYTILPYRILFSSNGPHNIYNMVQLTEWFMNTS
jgi:hypothetical protein